MDVYRAPKSKIKLYFKISMLILILVAIFFYFGSNIANYKVSKKKVRLGVVHSSAFKSEVPVSGKLVPKVYVTLTSKQGGIIKEVFVVQGAQVSVGNKLMSVENDSVSTAAEAAIRDYVVQETIAETDRFELAQTYETHALAVKLAESDYRLAGAQLKARDKLVNGGRTISDLELETYRLNYENANIKLDAAKKVLKSFQTKKRAKSVEIDTVLNDKYQSKQRALKERDGLELKATIGGVVQEINNHIGEYVSAGAVLVKIVDISSLYAVLDVSAYDTKKITPGMKVELWIADEKYVGSVSNINPDVKDNVVQIEAEIEKLDRTQKINSLVTGAIITQQKDNVLNVDRPENIVEYSEAEIFVVQGDKATKRKVKFGASSISSIEVKSGLNAGETILLSGVDDIPRGNTEITLN